MYVRTLGQEDDGAGAALPDLGQLTSQSVALNVSPLTMMAIGAGGLIFLYSVTKKTAGAVKKVRSGIRKRSARSARKRALKAKLASL
jgi:hypothetical protein